MQIRYTDPLEIDRVMALYDHSRQLMRANGNLTQWSDGYPSKSLILQEIADKHSFVCVDEQEEVVATFCFIVGDDPTYAKIYEGAWLNDEPYGVIHRLATSGIHKGIGALCLTWSFGQCRNIRVDTHRDNTIMQHLLEKHGFTRCGIIFVANGTERVAFHKIVGDNLV